MGSAASSVGLRVGRALLALAAVAAVAAAVAAVGALAALPDAAAGTVLVEAWRAYGLAVFAGLFTLLAARPRGYRGVWELVILHKVALTVTALVLSEVPGSGAVLVADGVLSVVLVAAYVLCRGWRAAPPGTAP